MAPKAFQNGKPWNGHGPATFKFGSQTIRSSILWTKPACVNQQNWCQMTGFLHSHGKWVRPRIPESPYLCLLFFDKYIYIYIYILYLNVFNMWFFMREITHRLLGYQVGANVPQRHGWATLCNSLGGAWPCLHWGHQMVNIQMAK